MNSFLVIVLIGALSYASALDCNNNPCNLGGYYVPSRGYQCIQVGTDALCTCPISGYELNVPCRLCNRPNPVNNVCSSGSGRLVACLETDDFGTSYGCVCRNLATGDTHITSDTTCDTTVTLTTRPTTTVTVPAAGTPPPCLNGGVSINAICNCPSGYTGLICEQKIDKNLCDRIFCKNGGVCAIRNPTGPFEAVCLCPYGTWGDYCELNGTLGSCGSGSCSNGGACKENVVGTTRFAYCFCPAGFKGPKCETQFFPCPHVGLFPDLEMYKQGKYFKCEQKGSSIVATQLSCPKGLRFSLSVEKCAY